MPLVRVKKKDKPNKKFSNRFLFFWCHGCQLKHRLDKRWNLSGSILRPTITPDFKFRLAPSPLVASEDAEATYCYGKIKEGKIHYGDDCTHQFAGQVVNMIDVDNIETEAITVSSNVKKEMTGKFHKSSELEQQVVKGSDLVRKMKDEGKL